MPERRQMDAAGAAMLVGFAALLGFNQVVIKVVNDGLQPVFFAALRSFGATACLWLWMSARGRRPRIAPGTGPAGVLAGVIFATEFVFLFLALDLTTVTRTSVIFYSMPVWLALGAHLLLPGERITPVKALGLAVAFAGVAWAILDRPAGGQASLSGDLCALGAALGWASIVLAARGTRLRELAPDMQIFWQVSVSGPILLALSLAFGPFIRDLAPIHLWGLGFQIVVMVSFGFVFWFWLLSIYPAAGVASFSFLAPIFGFAFGWLILGEEVGWSLAGALVLVSAGLVLINRPAKAPPGDGPPDQVPQKV